MLGTQEEAWAVGAQAGGREGGRGLPQQAAVLRCAQGLGTPGRGVGTVALGLGAPLPPERDRRPVGARGLSGASEMCGRRRRGPERPHNKELGLRLLGGLVG